MFSASNRDAATDVRRNPARSRYELIVDGQLAGVANYHQSDRTVVLTHTEMLPSMRGRGLAAKLVRHVLDDIRHQQKTVVPRCWFVAEFIDVHPDYQDLLAA